jgi:hypothetical protein
MVLLSFLVEPKQPVDAIKTDLLVELAIDLYFD